VSPIQLINPLDLPNWDDLISRHPSASPFHSSGWARVLQDTYGFTPFYACVFNGNTLSACLPLMEVDSFLTGKRGVSLPFTDFCEPLLNGTVSSRELTDFAVAFGRERHWKYLELRGGDFSIIHDNSTNSTTSPRLLQPSLDPSDRNKRNQREEPDKRYLSFSHHILDLTPGPDRLFKGLRESTRRNIRKAEKKGVTVRFATDLEAVKTYFRLHCLTRKRHGVPPQPWVFFENIHKNLISADKGFVALADYQGKKIAGAVYLTLGNSALYKFGASDLYYQNLRANNWVMLRAVRRLAEAGFRTLSFGRTEPENQGLIQFKSGWGGREESRDYFRYDFGVRDFIPGNGNGSAGQEKVLRKLPIPVLKWLGKMFYGGFGS
jgi:hypothetical protein